jgi:hypothetical protein
VTEEQIQALADHGLLRPKTEAGWRPAAGEEFPTECDNPPRKILYYRLNQSTLVIKQQ